MKLITRLALVEFASVPQRKRSIEPDKNAGRYLIEGLRRGPSLYYGAGYSTTGTKSLKHHSLIPIVVRRVVNVAAQDRKMQGVYCSNDGTSEGVTQTILYSMYTTIIPGPYSQHHPWWRKVRKCTRLTVLDEQHCSMHYCARCKITTTFDGSQVIR
jgi:hypothetical protein